MPLAPAEWPQRTGSGNSDHDPNLRPSRSPDRPPRKTARPLSNACSSRPSRSGARPGRVCFSP